VIFQKLSNRVWHEGLLFKLRLSGIGGRSLASLRDYLWDIKQCVVLSGAMPDIVSISAGVLQSLILGPLLHLLYINDKVTVIHSPISNFADNTTLYIEVDDPQRATDSYQY